MTASQRAFRLLKQRGETVCFAESLTGGLIAATFIENPGASSAIGESYVTSAEEAKVRLLGVSRHTLETEGVVSAACAQQMAAGARRRSGAHWGVSATGIAGPDGGSEEKPVGTVFIGVSCAAKTIARECHFGGDRMEVRRQAVCAALNALSECMEETDV